MEKWPVHKTRYLHHHSTGTVQYPTSVQDHLPQDQNWDGMLTHSAYKHHPVACVPRPVTAPWWWFTASQKCRGTCNVLWSASLGRSEKRLSYLLVTLSKPVPKQLHSCGQSMSRHATERWSSIFFRSSSRVIPITRNLTESNIRWSLAAPES